MADEQQVPPRNVVDAEFVEIDDLPSAKWPPRSPGVPASDMFGRRATTSSDVAAATEYRRLLQVPDHATNVIVHAFQTFGSVRKAIGWLNDQCGALDHALPIKLLLDGKAEEVEAELARIDEGVYV